MQLVGDFELEEIVDSEEVEHPAINSGLEEGVLVLGQAHVVQPPGHPLHRIKDEICQKFYTARFSGQRFYTFDLTEVQQL